MGGFLEKAQLIPQAARYVCTNLAGLAAANRGLDMASRGASWAFNKACQTSGLTRNSESGKGLEERRGYDAKGSFTAGSVAGAMRYVAKKIDTAINFISLQLGQWKLESPLKMTLSASKEMGRSAEGQESYEAMPLTRVATQFAFYAAIALFLYDMKNPHASCTAKGLSHVRPHWI